MVEGKERLVLVHPGGGNEMKSPEKKCAASFISNIGRKVRTMGLVGSQ